MRVYKAKVLGIKGINKILKRRYKKKYYQKKISDTRRTPWRIQIMYDAMGASIANESLRAFEEGNKLTQSQLAAEHNVSVTVIKRVLDQVRENWRETAIRDWDKLTQKKLAELEWIKQEAAAAWYESQKDSETDINEVSDHGIVHRTVTKGQTGDPRYLAQIVACIKSEMKLLGLEAPKEIEINTWETKLVTYLKDGKIAYKDVVEYLGESEAKIYAKKAGLLPTGRV